MVDSATATSAAQPTLYLDDVHVTYRVYEDRRPQLKDIVAAGFRRPASRAIHAVRGVSFTAFEGEAIGVIGGNGAGKSTLLRSMAGLLPPTSGAVYAHSQPLLLGVGAALQPGVSGRRNIELGGLALGMSHADVAAKTPEIIEFSGLAEFIDLPLRTYSSGMRARLHFAIATSVEPELLLIDEALAVGDADFKRRGQERIEELKAKAGTVFLVSHSLRNVEKTCDRALWLERGELVADGPVGEVVEGYRSKSRDPDLE